MRAVDRRRKRVLTPFFDPRNRAIRFPGRARQATSCHRPAVNRRDVTPSHFRPSPHLALFPIVYTSCKMDRYKARCLERTRAAGGTGVSPVLSRSRTVSGGVATVAIFQKPLKHPYPYEGRPQSALPWGGRQRCNSSSPRPTSSRRAASRPIFAAGFLGHGDFRRALASTTDEGGYPLQIP